MATQLQLRRGTEAQNDAFIGAEGEVTYDTNGKGIRVHDGTTVGGMRVPTLTSVQYPTADNNYTWYRVYSDGWVEQGGYVVINTSSVSAGTYSTKNIQLPVAMSCVCNWKCQAKHDRFNAGFSTNMIGAAASTVEIYQVNDSSSSSFANPYVVWEIKGMVA